MRRSKKIVIATIEIIAIVAVVAAITESSNAILSSIMQSVGTILTIFLIIFCLIYYGIGNKSKCPVCKGRFCLKREGENIVSKQDISVLVEVNTRNRNREIIGTQEQYVPGARIRHRVDYRCKKCGETSYKTYSEDVPYV